MGLFQGKFVFMMEKRQWSNKSTTAAINFNFGKFGHEMTF